MITRRRFLTLTAAALMPGRAEAADWRGTGFGADLSLRLEGPGASQALAELPARIAEIEARFSLYRASELTALNAAGGGRLSPPMARVLSLCDRLHGLTRGAFDPTVQPLWRALAEGHDPKPARALIGWDRVRFQQDRITLAPGQALTLNGLAQGFAADLIRAWLAGRGFPRALIDMGEYAALGASYEIGIADPEAGLLGQRRLEPGRALATSSPRALLVGGEPHILHPKGLAPLWSSVTVEADSAALADGLSTALVFAPRAEIRALKAQLGLGPVTLIRDGELETL